MTRYLTEGAGVPSSHLPFSAAVAAGPFVFVSGQASVDLAGAYVEGSFADEMDRSMTNVRMILAELGLDFADIVRVQAYLGDARFRDEFNLLYRTYFAPPFPARTTTMGSIGTLKFEIDVVAYRSSVAEQQTGPR